MKESVNIKEVILCTVLFLIIFILIDIFVVPKINIKTDFISDKITALMNNQEIAPSRLFVNIWRMSKNIYVDNTMNNQNWDRWKTRYLKNINTLDDAQVAINTMLASLNDPYIGFLNPKMFKRQKTVLEGSEIGQTIEYKITSDNIGIIKIISMLGEKTVDDFKNILIKTNDTKAIIIDLRDNNGGIVANAVVMANYMMDLDEILRIESRINTKYKRIYSANERIFVKKPIIILINKNTASAAEIFAGVLRVQANAIIIGEDSLGKNLIQQIIPVTNNCGIILSTYKYILPDGTDINRIGLKPDVYVKNNQMNTALDILRNLR